MENKKVFIGCSSRNEIDNKYFDVIKKVSNILIDNNYDLVFGASSNGMMGECYKLFLEKGKSISSYTVSKYSSDLSNIKSNYEVICDDTFTRTKELYKEADLILFLPGGTGTIAEIFSVLEENRTISNPKKIIIFNYDGYYNKLLDIINYCVINKFNDKDIYNYFKVVNNVEEFIYELNQ